MVVGEGGRSTGVLLYKLAKYKQQTKNYGILERTFFQKITFPARFSEHRGTLFDTVLCKLTNIFFEATTGIIVANI